MDRDCPNVARNDIVNAAEVASYDQVKQIILKIPGFLDNILSCSLGAGFLAVCIGSILSLIVVKSRMAGDSISKYKRLKNEPITMVLASKITTWTMVNGDWTPK